MPEAAFMVVLRRKCERPSTFALLLAIACGALIGAHVMPVYTEPGLRDYLGGGWSLLNIVVFLFSMATMCAARCTTPGLHVTSAVAASVAGLLALEQTLALGLWSAGVGVNPSLLPFIPARDGHLGAGLLLLTLAFTILFLTAAVPVTEAPKLLLTKSSALAMLSLLLVLSSIGLRSFQYDATLHSPPFHIFSAEPGSLQFAANEAVQRQAGIRSAYRYGSDAAELLSALLFGLAIRRSRWGRNAFALITTASLIALMIFALSSFVAFGVSTRVWSLCALNPQHSPLGQLVRCAPRTLPVT